MFRGGTLSAAEVRSDRSSTEGEKPTGEGRYTGVVQAPLPPADASFEGVRAWFNDMEISRAAGMHCVELTDAFARCTLNPGYRNPNGAVNGGLLASFVDQVGGALVAALVRSPDYASTADLTIRFLRPALAEPIVGEARLVRRGRTLLVLGLTVLDGDERECVTATGAWVVTANGAPPQSARSGGKGDTDEQLDR